MQFAGNCVDVQKDNEVKQICCFPLKKCKSSVHKGNRWEILSTSQVDWLEDREPGQIGGTHWRREEKSVKLTAVGVISC